MQAQVDAQFWNKLAENYARQPVADVPAYERKLKITKDLLGPRDIVLDVGCGTGSLAIELAPLVAQVHAVDCSREMIRIGRNKVEKAGLSNVTFHEGTAQALPALPAQSFDMVCAYNILHLIEERDAVLAQIKSLLKPGGYLVSSTACLADSAVPYGLILPIVRFFGKAPLVAVFKEKDLIAEFRNAGFESVQARDVGAKKTVSFVVAQNPT